METTENQADAIIRKNLNGCGDAQMELLRKYVLLLLEWNQKINLISRADTTDLWGKHILHSLSILFRWKLRPKSVAADVGTGGGLPGIPLAIMEPSVKFILIDSTRKKCNAVEDIAARLSLTNVKVLNARAEEVAGKDEFTHSFDYIMARAVAPMDDLVKWSGQFLKKREAAPEDTGETGKKTIPPGSYIFWKGGDIGEELRRTELKYKLKNISVYPLTQEEGATADNPDKKIVIITP